MKKIAHFTLFIIIMLGAMSTIAIMADACREKKGKVVIKVHHRCTNDNQCPGTSQCLRNGVCYADRKVHVDNRICGAQLSEAMFIQELQTPAPEVELLHFKAMLVPGANNCQPKISKLSFALIMTRRGTDTFWPEIKMTIDGQDATPLNNFSGGNHGNNWVMGFYSWDGEIFPVSNVNGVSIRIVCTNCDANMPAGTSIIMKLRGWWWVNNPGETLKSYVYNDFQHFTNFLY